MTLPVDTVTLAVGGLVYEGWTSVHIARGIERMTSEFAVSITPKVVGQVSPINFPLGTPAVLSIGGVPVITGFAETAKPSFNADSKTLAVEGRSRTCDVVDCSSTHPSGQFILQPALSIATQLVAEYGVLVSTDAPPSAPIQRFTVKRDEKIGQAIERLCELSGLVPTDDVAGNLVLTRPGLRRATTPLVQGVNMLSGEAVYSTAEVFSQYVCKGQRPGTDVDFGPAVAAVLGMAFDATSLRRRVLNLQSKGPLTIAAAIARANWEASTRAGRAVTATVTVQGWRQASGVLWTPGDIVPVVSPWLGLRGDMVIAECSYDLTSDAGTITTLSLALPDAYLLTPPLPKGGAAGAGGSALYFTGGV